MSSALTLNERNFNNLRGKIASQAPRIPWDRFIQWRFNWKPGEHVALIGPTGQGKTTLLMNILPQSRFNVVFATKPRDRTMDQLIQNGQYVKLEKWIPGMDPLDVPRRVLWPDASKIDSDIKQKEVFRDAFGHIYREGGWTVAIDELWWINEHLKLGHEVRVLLQQGRSLGISLIAATQRPARVPVEVYDQSTHLFFWLDNDKRNLDRLSDINARSSQLVKLIIQNLEKHQVLYVNTRTGAMLRTRAPILEGRG